MSSESFYVYTNLQKAPHQFQTAEQAFDFAKDEIEKYPQIKMIALTGEFYDESLDGEQLQYGAVGTICFSNAGFEDLKGKYAQFFQFLGPHKIKSHSVDFFQINPLDLNKKRDHSKLTRGVSPLKIVGLILLLLIPAILAWYVLDHKETIDQKLSINQHERNGVGIWTFSEADQYPEIMEMINQINEIQTSEEFQQLDTENKKVMKQKILEIVQLLDKKDAVTGRQLLNELLVDWSEFHK